MWEIFGRKRKALTESAAAAVQTVAEISQECLRENLKCVVHYGSTLYGKPTIASDIDVLVVTNPGSENNNPHQLAQKIISLSEEAGAPHGFLHLVIATEEEFTAYPPVHPAIFAAFMRGNWILPTPNHNE